MFRSGSADVSWGGVRAIRTAAKEITLSLHGEIHPNTWGNFIPAAGGWKRGRECFE